MFLSILEKGKRKSNLIHARYSRRESRRIYKWMSHTTARYVVICYLLFVICYLLFVICYLLFVICYLLFVICYLLFVICYLLLVTCWSNFNLIFGICSFGHSLDALNRSPHRLDDIAATEEITVSFPPFFLFLLFPSLSLLFYSSSSSSSSSSLQPISLLLFF